MPYFEFFAIVSHKLPQNIYVCFEMINHEGFYHFFVYICKDKQAFGIMKLQGLRRLVKKIKLPHNLKKVETN